MKSVLVTHETRRRKSKTLQFKKFAEVLLTGIITTIRKKFCTEPFGSKENVGPLQCSSKREWSKSSRQQSYNSEFNFNVRVARRNAWRAGLDRLSYFVHET